jgi:hypothetical protein
MRQVFDGVGGHFFRPKPAFSSCLPKVGVAGGLKASPTYQSIPWRAISDSVDAGER